MSLILFVGKPVWFKFQISRDFVRLCIGPFGAWIIFHDWEVLLQRIPGLVTNAERATEGKDDGP